MFTDKAKEKFEYWYKQKEISWIKGEDEAEEIPAIKTFHKLPYIMQWGVYLEFAESEGYYISTDFSTNYELTPNGWFDWYITDGKKLDEWGECKTRKEAQIECLKKLNDLLNKEI